MRLPFATLALATMTCFSTPMHAQEMRTITMSGYGSDWGIPNEAILNLSVKTIRPDPTESMNANSEVMMRLITMLKANGITERNLETSGFSIGPTYKETPEGRTLYDELVGYKVSNGLEVTIEDADRVGEFIKLAGSDKDVRLDDIFFYLSSTQEKRVIARGRALDDARVKAAQVAEKANAELGDIIKVVEGSQYERPKGDYADMPAPAIPLERGIQWITEDITVTWQIKNKGQ
jgi:uncharacterized protein YggE